MSGRRAQTDAQADEGPTRGRRRRRGEGAQEEGRVEWRQFATKIQMNDEKSRKRVSPSGIGMGARIPTDVSSVILGIAFLYISFPACSARTFGKVPHFGRHFSEWGARAESPRWTISGTTWTLALAIRPFPEKEGKTDEDDDEMGES